MPLRLNVGASQKVSDEHYGSRGASVNLDIELDSSLASDSAKLQDRIRQLFTLVRQSLAEELRISRNGTAPSAHDAATPPASPSTPINGNKQANGKQNGKRLATSAQVKALYALAKERGFNLREMVRDRYHLERPEQFTIQQASDLIGALKSSDE